MDLKDIIDFLLTTARSVGAELTSPWFYLQFGLILAAAGIALAAGAAIRSRVDMDKLGNGWPLPLRLFMHVLVGSAPTAVFAVLVIVARVIMWHTTWPSRSYLLMVSAKLALAWIAIRLVTSTLRSPFIVRVLSISAWVVAALSIIGELDPTIDALDSVELVLGGFRLTPLILIKLGVLLIVALWLTNIASNVAEGWIARSSDLTPSVQVLLVKMIRLGLMITAVAAAVSAVGINLSALAIFSGAAGVGIGFGLQKIIANFMTNWTYTDKNTLVKVTFGTNYEADPHQVCKLAIEIAAKAPRALRSKPPNCILTDFTDAGMRFSLTFWIADPDGMDGVKSDVMLALWDAFKRDDIHVPYPVRVIRVRDGALPVQATTDLTT
jgi:small-conductance mechanosensitive channel